VAVFLSFSVAVALVIGQAQSARCWFYYTTEGPDTALGGNTIVDIKYDGTYLWLATSKGITRATPDGEEFVNFGADVLNSREISAVAARPGEVWVSPSSSRVHSNQNIPYGEGFNVSYDNGDTWGSLSAEQAEGPGRICYDIAFLDADNSVWAACFYGGLIRTRDGGSTWENIFPSPEAAGDFYSGSFRDYNNRFFAVITDETSEDSIIVWAGSAKGIKKFIFFDASLKVFPNYGSDILLTGDAVWLATEAGLSLSLDAGRLWRTFAEDEGFPTSYVASVFVDANGIWAGVGADFDPAVGITVGAGIMHSSDGGSTWKWFEPDEAMGEGSLVTDFAYVNGVTFAACGNGGLIYTTDNGLNWESDLPAHATAGAYHSLVTQDRDTDTILWAGTDDDLYEFVFTASSSPDTLIKHSIDLDTTSFSNVISVVEIQRFTRQDTVREVIWTLHQAAGDPQTLDGYAYSVDGGEQWMYNHTFGHRPFDIGFSGPYYYLGTEDGVLKDSLDAPLGEGNWLTDLDAILGGDDGTTDVRSLSVSGDVVWVGSDVGIAISPDTGATWARISDPDYIQHFRAGDSDSLISGNFITALAMQQYPGKKVIWAATQQTSTGQTNGVSVTFDDGATWDVVLSNVLAWNFAFDGPRVYAATSQGLLISPDYGEHWDTVDVFMYNGKRYQTSQGIEVYSVWVLRDTIWVGTENGLSISFDGGVSWRVLRRYESIGGEKSPEPYATPVPFSPSDRITPGNLYFHFVPPVDGPVKITIYDFSNCKVIEIDDWVLRQAGTQYDQTHSWDGRNERGDVVATGTYFFVVEYADGSTQWGKLVILP